MIISHEEANWFQVKVQQNIDTSSALRALQVAARFLYGKHYSWNNLISIRTQFHQPEQVNCTHIRDVPDLYLGRSTDCPHYRIQELP
jgi:hypothetical protein